MIKNTDHYAEQTIDETLKAFKVNAGQGLSDTKAAEQIKQFGYNEIEEREESLWHRLFRRFWGPIPWMIEVAALLSALVRNGKTSSLSRLCCWSMPGWIFFRNTGR